MQMKVFKGSARQGSTNTRRGGVEGRRKNIRTKTETKLSKMALVPKKQSKVNESARVVLNLAYTFERKRKK